MAFEISQLERLLGDEWNEVLPPICLECGYDLTGLPDNRCPECGNIFIRGEVRRQARDMRNQLRQLRTCNDMIRLGWSIGLGTGGLVGVLALLAALVDPGFWAMGKIFGLLGGFPTVAMGMQVVRVLRLPVWAREQVNDCPDVYKGVAVAMLGVGLLLTAVLLF